MRILHNPTFRNLWAANTISSFGTLFGALSLTALIYLDASPAEMGVLAAATSMPVLLFALVAGVWVDRLPRVPVMVAADLGRFAALMTVPVAAAAGHLRIEQIYAVSFVAGCLNVMFNLAFRSVLPVLVPRDRVVDANSTLGMSESVAASASPAIGGGIAQGVGGPVAVLIDATTFLISGLLVSRIGSPAGGERPKRRSALAEAFEGLRAVVHQPVLRAVFGMVATYSFFGGFIVTLYGLWVIDGLGFSAFTLGVLLASGGIGAVVGAWLAGPTARSLGLGRSIVATYIVAAALLFLTPLAGGPVWLAFMMLLTEQCVGDAFWTIHNIHAMSMRQSITPDERLGRVNAFFLLASQGLRPIGALIAGVAAGFVGVKAGLLISAVGINLAGLWLILSPLPWLTDASWTPPRSQAEK
ncbi:MAG: MFS transporter [Dehalococcoidia bacterium]